MSGKTFRRYLVEETEPGKFNGTVGEGNLDDLSGGDTLIRVHYSSLNYKDALSATGNKGVTKKYPHTPGIDAAGEVVSTGNRELAPGQEVIVTGYDLGMNTSGGFAEYISVPGEWVCPLPDGLQLKESMILGTAGLTAALSVRGVVNNGINPDDGAVLVTGSTGGVGSLAVAILAKCGFNVSAVTGKADQAEFLKTVGAHDVVPRSQFLDVKDRPLLKESWAAVIDTVGGEPLNVAVRSAAYGGTVTTCGMVASPKLNLTVFPFILRGVSLLGIDSVQCAHQVRNEIWSRLATEWRIPQLDAMSTEIGLDDINEYIPMILDGRVRGRTVVAV